MFRSRRSTLVKRLWKSKIIDKNEAQCSYESPNHTSRNSSQQTSLLHANEEDMQQIKAVAQAMLKRLKERHLEVLVQAVESQGGEKTDCVLLPRDTIRLGRRGSVAPHVLCCQIWRWTDLTDEQCLKRQPCCEDGENSISVCCNPYHWSLRVPESPPPYCKAAAERVLVKQDGLDKEEETPVSMETGGTPTALRLGEDGSSSNSSRPFWCNIAYWEHRQRVGRLYTVFDPSVTVFQELPHGDGMCLGILQSQTSAEPVKRTREKIGPGLSLSREKDGLWLYNHSAYPIFVNSPTFYLPDSRTFIVKKVLPGYSLRIFDFELSEIIKRTRDPQFVDGPYDSNSIRISFVKGWGPSYSRQFVTSCPCWIEVLLSVNR